MNKNNYIPCKSLCADVVCPLIFCYSFFFLFNNVVENLEWCIQEMSDAFENGKQYYNF